MGNYQLQPKVSDTWASGQSYELYVARWSRLVVAEFLKWLAVLPQRRWLDVGCGTGALSQTVLQLASPTLVRGIDPSQGYISFAREHIRDSRVTFEVGDAESLQFESNTFDVAVAGLVLNFVPKPARAVTEMSRVTRPGGIVAAYVWDYAGEMQMMRYFWNAAVALDAAAATLDEGNRFPICKPEPLEELFAATGLVTISVRPIDVPTRFRDFDDYWTPFLGGQMPAPSFAMSLNEERRNMLRDQIRARLPVAFDGSINLIARAWAVRGEKLQVA
jgi:SAM-dependent methyltransferase